MSLKSYKNIKVINTKTKEIFDSIKKAHFESKIDISYSHFKKLFREGKTENKFNLIKYVRQ